MFLLGGPAFSGKTLLAYLLNQNGIVCLDEPDFHNLEQSQRGIPFLKNLFPGKNFPPAPEKKLTYAEAVELMHQCEATIYPNLLGMKTSNWVFIEYAKIYKRLGYPVIALIRDIRDALAEAPLPEWVTEKRLNKAYREIWKNLKLYDLCFRYEDLVAEPDMVITKIMALLQRRPMLTLNWDARNIPSVMLKLERHDLLKKGMIVRSQVGIWRNSKTSITRATQKTASLMGYRD